VLDALPERKRSSKNSSANDDRPAAKYVESKSKAPSSRSNGTPKKQHDTLVALPSAKGRARPRDCRSRCDGSETRHRHRLLCFLRAIGKRVAVSLSTPAAANAATCMSSKQTHRQAVERRGSGRDMAEPPVAAWPGMPTVTGILLTRAIHAARSAPPPTWISTSRSTFTSWARRPSRDTYSAGKDFPRIAEIALDCLPPDEPLHRRHRS